MLEIIRILSDEELQQAFSIRRIVFVEEQQVEERIEYEFEEDSIHFLALKDGQAVGTARWRRTDKGIKLERFAVLAEHRSSGVGSALLKTILQDIPNDVPYVYLHAQLSAIGLYAKFGFVPEGDQFEEAGIQHYKMARTR